MKGVHRIAAGTKAARMRMAKTAKIHQPQDQAQDILDWNAAVEKRRQEDAERKANDRQLLSNIALIEGR